MEASGFSPADRDVVADGFSRGTPGKNPCFVRSLSARAVALPPKGAKQYRWAELLCRFGKSRSSGRG